MPLNVKSQAFLIDPTIQPRGTVSSIEVLCSEVQLQLWIVLAKEKVLTGVIKIGGRDLIPVH